MNALLAPGAQIPTMTSREIAELCEKEISHVHRDIRTMLEQLGDDPDLNHLREDKDSRGYTTCFHLPKSLTMTLIAGYNVKLRKAIIDRWQALEAGTAPAFNLRQPAQMLAVAMQLAEMVQEQQAQLAAQAPKVKFAEAVGASEDLQPIGDVAKVLGTGSRRMFSWLRDNGILTATNLPIQHHLDAGRFRVVERTWKDGDGRNHISVKTMVTGRGITFLQQKWAKAKEAVNA